jgi:hypothetical protein
MYMLYNCVTYGYDGVAGAVRLILDLLPWYQVTDTACTGRHQPPSIPQRLWNTVWKAIHHSGFLATSLEWSISSWPRCWRSPFWYGCREDWKEIYARNRTW